MGVGPDRAALERQALLPPPNVRVHFAGFRKDAARCLGALDVFIMPSRYEGFGISLIEAMAHGVPAVASDVDSLPELMRSYPNGVCVDFSEPSVAAAAILDAARKPRIPLQPFPFSVNTMITEYEALYARVTNSWRRPGSVRTPHLPAP